MEEIKPIPLAGLSGFIALAQDMDDNLNRMYAGMLAGGATMVRARDEGVEFVAISPDELFASPSEQTGE